VLDVGSGAGFPGVPLALVNPEKHFLLLDSAGKRVRFLRHVVRTLGLENVTVSQSRVEEFKHGAPFDTIVSRAFSSLALYAARVGHLAGDLTRMLAIKGRLPSEELAALSPSVKVEAVEAYQVPGLHAERHVVIMSLSSQRS
jgi:16S rRNA (guanine527-N7)-methyltransferase